VAFALGAIAVVNPWLRVTPAKPVTTPDEAASSALLKVMLTLSTMSVITVLAGMPTPVTIWPRVSPAVLVVSRVVERAGMVPVMVAEPAAKMPVIVAPAGIPVPRMVRPVASPVTSARARVVPPSAPETAVRTTCSPKVEAR